jgi:hypothetical protein
MKKLILLPLLFAGLFSFAGWEMSFCDSVDQKGNCIGLSEIFIFSKPLQVNVLLANKAGLQTSKIYFEILLLDINTFAEELVITEEVKTEPALYFVSQSIHFSKKGHYIIKARDSFKDYITSRELEVK